MIEGQYPEYQKIIPESVETTVKITIEDFVTIVKRVNLFAKEVSNSVKLVVKQDGIECISNDAQIGNEQAFLKCEVVGPEKEIAFNAEYVIDALNNIDGEIVSLGINTSLTPGVLKNPEDPTYTQIVMPLKV